MNPKSKGNGRKRKRELDGLKQEERPSSNDFSLSAGSSSASSSSLFLTPQDPGFEKHIKDHYRGFVHSSVDNLQPRDFHQQARAALERLRDANYYQYDIVMAGGKHSSRTFVKRTLVGNPGITYKYLGLRLFAHAWSGPGVTPSMKAIGEMNKRMIHMTEQFPNHQKCNYNLTLINYMEPTIRTRVGFKEEANYRMGKVSVSWHADSSLESGSSIGVYHCLPTQRSTKWDWRIALRPSPDGSKSDGSKPKNVIAKPVVVDTKDGDVYFLLGGFNETHQHCVLAGSQSNRISSTHRVAVSKEDTYEYILKRVKIARKRFRIQMESIVLSSAEGNCLDAKVIRYCQKILTEVEMEWIAQYWLQGAQHDKMHIWWQRPMKTLEAYWRVLEAATWKLYDYLCSSSNKDDHTNNSTSIHVDVLKVLVNEFKTRQSLREQWDERRAGKIYQRRIAKEYHPVARPIFGEINDSNQQNNDEGEGQHRNKEEGKRLPKDLTSSIQHLQFLLGKISSRVPTKSNTAEKDLAGRSKMNQPGSTSARTVRTDGISCPSGSAGMDRPTGTYESKSKKKRGLKKKRK